MTFADDAGADGAGCDRSWPAQAAHNRSRHHLAERGAGGLLALGELLVQGAADDAGIGLLCIADDASFMDRLSGEAEVGGRRRRNRVLVRNAFPCSVMCTDHLSSVLRGVVLVRQPALRLGLDVESGCGGLQAEDP